MDNESQLELTDTLSGAASGAALGSSVLPGWGTLIGGVIGAGYGLYQGYTAGESNKNRPQVTTPDYIKQNMNQAQQDALEGLPEEQKQQFIKNLQRSQSYGLSQLGTRKAGLTGVATLNQQNNDALEGLSVADAQARQANKKGLYGARQTMADYQDRNFEQNQLIPYYEQKSQQQASQGAAASSINNAANFAASEYGASQRNKKISPFGGYGATGNGLSAAFGDASNYDVNDIG